MLHDGSMLVSDDFAGAVYRISYGNSSDQRATGAAVRRGLSLVRSIFNVALLFWPARALAIALLAASPALAGDAAAGKQKAAMCAVCHGLNGIAKNPDAPNLAGDNANYIMKQLHAFKNGDRKDPQMSIIAGSLTEEDIANVAAWYSSLKVTVEMPQ